MATGDDWYSADGRSPGGEELVRAGDGARAPLGAAGRILAVLSGLWLVLLLYTQDATGDWLNDRLVEPLGALTGLALPELGVADLHLVHLVFAVAVACLAFPLFATSSRMVVPLYDWVLIALAVAAAAYLLAFRVDIETRVGLLLRTDFIAAGIGLLVLLFSIFRCAGWLAFAVVFCFAAFAVLGETSFAPGAASWDAESAQAGLRRFWLEDDGVFAEPFRIALGLLFPLVLFGTLWVRAGAGAYMANVAAASFGDGPGGAAKAVVMGSILSGSYAASSRADAARRDLAARRWMAHAGSGREPARAAQDAGSSYAQAVPPLMGAALLLVAERTGLPVARVTLHALLPAIAAYVMLFAYVHFDARAVGAGGLPVRPVAPNRIRNSLALAFWCLFACALALAALWGLAWIRSRMPEATLWVSVAAWAGVFLVLVWISSRRPDIADEDDDEPVAELAPVGAAVASGLHLLLPLFFLVVQVAGAGVRPAEALLWCAALAAAISLTQHPLKALFRGQYDYMATAARRGLGETFGATVQAARYFCPVLIAAAAAGIILSGASLSGFDGWLTGVAERLSSLGTVPALAILAAIAVLLGTGTPTAIGYLLGAALVLPAIGAATGDPAAPLVVLHLALIYLCAFAGSARLGRLKLGLLAVAALIVIAPHLTLVDVPVQQVPVVVATTVLGAVAAAAAMRRYLVRPNRIWETAALALAAFTLFHPGYWLDRLEARYDTVSPDRIFITAAEQPEAALMHLTLSGPDISDAGQTRTAEVVVLLDDGESGSLRLERSGLTIRLDGNRAIVEAPFPDTEFDHLNSQFDFEAGRNVELTEIRLPVRGRTRKEIFYLPALALFILVWLVQRRRLRRSLDSFS